MGIERQFQQQRRRHDIVQHLPLLVNQENLFAADVELHTHLRAQGMDDLAHLRLVVLELALEHGQLGFVHARVERHNVDAKVIEDVRQRVAGEPPADGATTTRVVDYVAICGGVLADLCGSLLLVKALTGRNAPGGASKAQVRGAMALLISALGLMHLLRGLGLIKLGLLG